MSKTVLFTASTYSHITQFHLPYIKAFRDLGWTVHVACGGVPAPIGEADVVLPLPFEKKMSSPANFRAQKLLRQAMVQNRYSLICTHTSLAAFFTRRAAAGLRARPPLVSIVHGYLFDEGTPLFRRAILLEAERLTAPQTDLLLTMNRTDYETAVRYRLGARIVNIPGVGVDFSRLDTCPREDGIALRTRLGAGEGNFLLLYAAEFSTRKNQMLLIRALPQLPRNVRLLLPGQGALWEECRAAARALGVADRVVFPGQRTDIPIWYRAADAAVSTSRSEGLPFNIMEAMYAGLPVIASTVKGHTDLITDGLNGLLYPYGDANAFTAQVGRLLKHPDFGTALGNAARGTAASYGLSTVLPRVMEQYLSLIPEDRKSVPV